MRRRLCLSILSLTVTATSAVRADAPADPDPGFRLGREAMAKGQWQRALSLLRESHKASPGRGKLANIAICEARVGLVGSATRHIEELLRELPASDERREALAKEAQRIAPKVPRLRVSLAPGAPPDTRAELDGEALEIAAEIAVDPGPHVVIASAGAARAKRFEVTLPEGGRHTLLISPEPESSAVGPRSAAWKVGVASLGVGGASLIVGAVTGALFLRKNSALVAACPNDVCPRGFDLDSALRARTALGVSSTVTLIAGGVIAAGGVVLIATSRSDPPQTSTRVTPFVGLGSVGAAGWF